MILFSDRLPSIQQKLNQQKIDGWLFYDFRCSNDLACEFLEIPSSTLLTRRFCYWVPQKGEPIKIVSIVEPHVLDHLPGTTQSYRSWKEFEGHICSLLQNVSSIAMEYSPRNAIPSVSKVDAGTMEIIRNCHVEVMSSADLLQSYMSVWDAYKLSTHLAAAQILDATASNTWQFIKQKLKNKETITEYDVQQFMLDEFKKNKCMTNSPPICAVNEHSADPHYSPSKINPTVIKEGDFILIDLWCKQDVPKAVYADITRVGVAADKPTEKQQKIFSIVKRAQEEGTKLVQESFASGTPLMGWEVDQTCRKVIEDAGYGPFFVHRTGHNIDIQDHGNGANLDNLETQDRRLLLPGTCFSIEPGIYLSGEFGVRLEYDVYVHHDGHIQITGGIQEQIYLV